LSNCLILENPGQKFYYIKGPSTGETKQLAGFFPTRPENRHRKGTIILLDSLVYKPSALVQKDAMVPALNQAGYDVYFILGDIDKAAGNAFADSFDSITADVINRKDLHVMFLMYSLQAGWKNYQSWRQKNNISVLSHVFLSSGYTQPE